MLGLRRSRPLLAFACSGLVAVVFGMACGEEEDPSAEGGSVSSDGLDSLGNTSLGDESEEVGSGGAGTTGGTLTTSGGDTQASAEGGDPCADTGGLPGCECQAPVHIPCDDSSSDVPKAMGLGCEGETPVTLTGSGNQGAAGTRTNFGNQGAFAPREGERFAVLGSGYVADLDNQGFPACDQDLGNFDPGTNLPAPLDPRDVGGAGCEDDPSLIGQGDCSNTIETQFEASNAGAFDYTELRVDTVVPFNASSFTYDFAFFSYEYPQWYGSQFNDIYIGWLESETWTGNISFDDDGNPISLNAGFMDYLDADALGHPTCNLGANCSAPELHGTCMQGHGGTRWLSTQAAVTPGETITIVFAIMDLGDSALDSYVFLDNFTWGCEGGSPPSTVPID